MIKQLFFINNDLFIVLIFKNWRQPTFESPSFKS